LSKSTGEEEHDICSGLRVGNIKDKNRVMPREESLTGMEEHKTILKIWKSFREDDQNKI
jgi:hypothetical protein